MNEEQELQTVGNDGGDLLERVDDTFTESIVKASERIEVITRALEKVICTRIYRNDWTMFGSGDNETFSLSAAGAERLLLVFPFKFSNTETRKETWTDDIGSAYRYVTEVDCELYGSKLRVNGTFSTRDKLLGFKDQHYRDISEINENDIEKASYRTANGNAIKTLLGLRHMPVEEIERIYSTLGQKQPAKKVEHAETMSADDKTHRTDFINILKELTDNDETAMKELLKEFTIFKGKDGKDVFMKTFSENVCKGKWLLKALANAKKYKDEQDAQMAGINNESEGGIL